MLKNNVDNSGIHNKVHNFMNHTLDSFNVIHINGPETLLFRQGQILAQRSYGNFKMTRIMRRRPDEHRLHESGVLYKPKNNQVHSMIYLSRYKNNFKLKNTLIEED